MVGKHTCLTRVLIQIPERKPKNLSVSFIVVICLEVPECFSAAHGIVTTITLLTHNNYMYIVTIPSGLCYTALPLKEGHLILV